MERRDEDYERGSQDDDNPYQLDEILRQQYGNYDAQELERDRERMAAENQQAKRDQELLKEELEKNPRFAVPGNNEPGIFSQLPPTKTEKEAIQSSIVQPLFSGATPADTELDR